MIEEISIRDLGVIAEATLPLGPGFTAVTGETGAGKTMVVSALGLLLGSRADAATVRRGSTQSWVEGRWLVDDNGPVAERVRDAGGDLDSGELILSRSVSAEGRSRAVVGGRSAPIGVLSDLADQLVVVHGQSDQVRLRSATAQREALDRFAGSELADQLKEYRGVYADWAATRDELELLVDEQERRVREAEQLRAALDEIISVDPQLGEDAELSGRAERLGNLEELRQAASLARENISSESSDGTPDAVALLDGARRQLERVATHDAELAGIASALAEAEFLVAEVSTQLAGYLAGLDVDGGRELDAVQERRAVLGTLTRKYGPGLGEVLEFLDTGSGRLLELDGDTERIDALRERRDSERARVGKLAESLTVLRTAAGERLAGEVTAELAALAMPDATVSVAITPREELGGSGGDHVQLLLAPHRGAESRPIAKGASGGELSRVMLALEVVIAGSDHVPTFVFDEIDAGVGGAAAIEIGRRLAKLAASAQVIVVTHLAQVAAFANNHLSVVKGSDGQVTASSVQQLVGDERSAEMARLLSGMPDSELGLAHARELMSLAQTH